MQHKNKKPLKTEASRTSNQGLQNTAMFYSGLVGFDTYIKSMQLIESVKALSNITFLNMGLRRLTHL